MIEHGQTSIDDDNNAEYFIHRGIHHILDDRFEQAITALNEAIELDPSLIAYQLRALCESYLFDKYPTGSQVVKIVSDLTEALRLATELFDSSSDNLDHS